MVIDERKEHVLTNFSAAKMHGKAIDTDHFTEYLDLDLEIKRQRRSREEFLKFKNPESQIVFKKLTSETQQFTSCFKKKGQSIALSTEIWKKNLKSVCKKSFKKIRIRQQSSKPVSREIKSLLQKKRNILKENKDLECVKNIDILIADTEAKENRNMIKKEFGFLSENPENLNLQSVWKSLKKLRPKFSPTLPTAKRNPKGVLVTDHDELKVLIATEYKNRLRERGIKPGFEELRLRRQFMFDRRIKLSEARKNLPWCMKDLDEALSDLKNNKSRDCDGFINEIFKNDIIGSNLKDSLLEMFNLLREKQFIPEFMNDSNITTVGLLKSWIFAKHSLHTSIYFFPDFLCELVDHYVVGRFPWVKFFLKSSICVNLENFAMTQLPGPQTGTK